MGKKKSRRILVLTEKHGTRYIAADTDEDLGKAALRILKERTKDGCWYMREELPEAFEYRESDISNLPKSLQASASSALRQYRDSVRWVQATNATIDEIERVIREKDTKRAWRALYDRSGFEYERARLETLEDP